MIFAGVLFGLMSPLAVADVEHPLVATFVSACVDGSVKLAPGTARQVSFKQLPPVLRRQYSQKWVQSSYYEISSPVRGYLLTMRGPTSKTMMYHEVCAIAGPDLPFEQAHRQVLRSVFGITANEKVGTSVMLEYYDAKQGFIVSARKLQSNWGTVKIARPNGPYKGIFGNTPGLPVKSSDKPSQNLLKQDQ